MAKLTCQRSICASRSEICYLVHLSWYLSWKWSWELRAELRFELEGSSEEIATALRFTGAFLATAFRGAAITVSNDLMRTDKTPFFSRSCFLSEEYVKVSVRRQEQGENLR